MRDRRRPDAFLFAAALCVLVLTLSLTYVWDILPTFRGSTLVYLAWVLLVLGGILSHMSESRYMGRATTVIKYVLLSAGLVLIAFAVALSIWAEKMFDWIPAM